MFNRIHFVRYMSKADSAPKADSALWPDVAVMLSAYDIRAAKDGAAWSPIVMNPCTSPCRNHGWAKRRDCGGNAWHRLKENVAQVHAAVFDVDHLSLEDTRELFARLEASGLALVIHSTHTHAPPEDHRFRVTFPISRPLTAVEWETFRANVDREIFKGKSDPSAKDCSRLFYLPSRPEGSAEPIKGILQGEPIDVDAYLGIATGTAPASAPSGLVAAAIAEPGPIDIDAMKRRLKALRSPKGVEIARRLLKPLALEEPGAQDDRLNQCASLLVWLFESAPTSALVQLALPSLALMDWQEGLDHLRSEFESKIERARPRIAATKAERAKQDAEILALFQQDAAASDTAGAGPYTEAQIAKWAEEQGTDPEQFRKRWIIQHGPAFYVFSGGRYLSPISRESLDVSLPRDLSRAPIRFEVPTKEATRPAKMAEILRAHATAARKVEASLILDRSFYDAGTMTFHEAICPPRALEPLATEEIQRWLEILGGKNAGKLLDWVATVNRLDRQTCALYFEGSRGTGKTLLATGLARLWTTGAPTDIKSVVLSDFNSALASCPLILADEEIPKSRHESSTSVLRTLIGTTERRLARKYMPDATIRGAVRLVITANNDRLLQADEDLSADDLDAIATRFLHIRVTDASRLYLEQIGGPPVIQKHWIDGDLIARHALHLARTRKIEEGRRFLIEGETTELHAQLATSSGVTPQVCEWIVACITNPAVIDRLPDGAGARIGDGRILVSTETIAHTWDLYLKGIRVPTATRIGRTLRSIAAADRPNADNRYFVGGKQIRLHSVRPDLILGWAERNLIGDPDLLKSRIEGKLQ